MSYRLLLLCALCGMIAAEDNGSIWHLMEDEQALVVDLRPPEAFATDHHPAAVNLDPDIAADSIATMARDPERPIILIDDNGHHAGLLADMLRNREFRQVHIAGSWDIIKTHRPDPVD